MTLDNARDNLNQVIENLVNETSPANLQALEDRLKDIVDVYDRGEGKGAVVKGEVKRAVEAA